MKTHRHFTAAILEVKDRLRIAGKIRTEKWQGIQTRPEMETYEILNHSFQVPVEMSNLTQLALDIGPNLPWADDHFMERVGGQPLNPGIQWRNWPWAHSADRFREAEQFNHTYMERFWPKYAGMTPQGVLSRVTGFKGDEPIIQNFTPLENHFGIRNDYGDLNDLVSQLLQEPNTRQAYLPIFFPEDTGGAVGGRVPCTLGYHFIHRHGFFHIVYYLRSCDFVRHFRDDIYLAVRLQLWVLDRLKETGVQVWKEAKPGMFTMHITSMHMFINDYPREFGGGETTRK